MGVQGYPADAADVFEHVAGHKDAQPNAADVDDEMVVADGGDGAADRGNHGV